MAKMLAILFAITTLICAAGWLCRKISVLMLLTYIIKKGYKPPDDEELEACRKFVVEQIVRDVTKKATRS